MLKYTIVGSTPRFASLGKFTSYMVFIYGLPWWLRWERIGLQCGRPGFSPWLGKIPWRRAWHPTPVFLPGESHRQRNLAGYTTKATEHARRRSLLLMAQRPKHLKRADAEAACGATVTAASG